MDTADPVLPDIIVLLPDQLYLQSERGIEGPPALLIEVLSHYDPKHDRVTKRALYVAQRGARFATLVPVLAFL